MSKLDDFRNTEILSKGFRKLMNDPILRAGLVAIRDSGPATERTQPGTDATAACIRLGRIEGYDLAVSNFLSLGQEPLDLNMDADLEHPEKEE